MIRRALRIRRVRVVFRDVHVSPAAAEGIVREALRSSSTSLRNHAGVRNLQAEARLPGATTGPDSLRRVVAAVERAGPTRDRA